MKKNDILFHFLFATSRLLHYTCKMYNIVILKTQKVFFLTVAALAKIGFGNQRVCDASAKNGSFEHRAIMHKI